MMLHLHIALLIAAILINTTFASSNSRRHTEELGIWKIGPPTNFINCSSSKYDYSYFVEKCYYDEETGLDLEEEWGGQVRLQKLDAWVCLRIYCIHDQ